MLPENPVACPYVGVRMAAFKRIFRDLMLLVTRFCVGVMLILHGVDRWQGGVEVQLNELSKHHIPHAELLTIATTVFEIIGGILLIFGLLTRFIGLGMMVQNVFIIFAIKFQQGFFLPDGFEFNLALAVIGLLLLTFGSGRIAVDQLFRPLKPANNNTFTAST